MTYREILTHIYRRARFGIKPGLERISATLAALGNPHLGIRVVHVVGTNGKGSTAAFLSAMAAAGGHKVGLFTSPHLERFTERIRVAGKEIAEEALLQCAARVLRAAPPETTFFEIVTALALLHFAEERVSLAVLEAGMGGRLDATNVADGLLTVLTPVSLDHCEYLGGTLAEIAMEKIGVAKPGRPLVVSPQQREVLKVLRRESERLSSPLYLAGTDFTATWQSDGLLYQGLNVALAGLNPGIPGRYQAINAASALCAAEILDRRGFALDASAMRQGLQSARWPGRMELIGDHPRHLLDGAHNAAGGEALASALADIPHERLFVVAGVMGDKNAAGILGRLLPLARTVFAVAPAIERAMPSAELAAICRERGADTVDAGSVAVGLELAKSAASPADLILVCGSLFTVGEARSVLLAAHYEPCRG